MTRIFYIISFMALFHSCNSAKKYFTPPDSDKAFFDVVNRLSKKSNDAEAVTALPTLYAEAQKRHLNLIEALGNTQGIAKWKDILAAYETLQRMYQAINNCPKATELVQAVSYQAAIDKSRMAAAAEYYQRGETLLENGKRTDALKAYQHFKSAIGFVPGYKDAAQRMEEAYDSGIMYVQINQFAEVPPNGIYADASFIIGILENYRYRLVADLNKKLEAYPIEIEAGETGGKNGVATDCTVEVSMNNFAMTDPKSNQNTYEMSKQIIESYDTSRNPVYTNVHASITIHQLSVTGSASFGVNITETGTGVKITSKNFKQAYSWKSEYANYRGDDRALGIRESKLVNQGNFGVPPDTKTVLANLCEKIYPQLKAEVQEVLKAYLKNKGYLSE